MTTTTAAPTIAQFIATGRDADLSVEPCAEGMDDMGQGRVYDDNYWLERQQDGQWFTILGNAQVIGTLEECEQALYEFMLCFEGFAAE